MTSKKLTLPGDEAARRLVKLFRQAERDIAARLAQLLSETDDKRKRSIRAIEQEQKAVKKILKELLESSEEEAQLLVDNAFNGGLSVAKQELETAGISEIVVEMGGVNSRALKVYSEQIYNRLAEVVQQASRTTADIYQALKVDSAMAGAVGGYDALGTVRRNMQKISAERGISAFIDKKGRSWTMATYCEMLTRTATAEIFHQAKTNEYLAHGEDLVIVTYHTPTCEKCSPWDGKVLSLTGETQGYPTMAEAKASGLFHPNCRHTYSLYIEAESKADNHDDTDSVSQREEQFVPSGNLEDAVVWAKVHALAENIDYTGLKIDVVNELNEGVYNAQKLFPELRTQFKFIGSCQGHMKFIYETQIQKRLEQLKRIFADEPESELLERARKMIKKQRVSGQVFAFSVRIPEYAGISINSKYGGNIQKFKDELSRNVKLKFHPIGCDSIKSVIDHEMGHEIDKLFDLSNDDYVKSIFTFLMKKDKMRDELSGYAKENIKEFIAEAWAEYQNNPDPRDVAKMIGEHIMSLRRNSTHD